MEVSFSKLLAWGGWTQITRALKNKLIRERKKITQSNYKSYVNNRIWEFDFKKVDW